MQITINVDDLSKYLSDEQLENIVESKVAEIIKEKYDNSLSNMVYERIDNAIALLITDKIVDDEFEKILCEKVNQSVTKLPDYQIFNYDYSSGRPKNEPARALDRVFNKNLESKLRRKLIKQANARIKSVTKDDIINWTCDGINETISELFKCKEN